MGGRRTLVVRRKTKENQDDKMNVNIQKVIRKRKSQEYNYNNINSYYLHPKMRWSLKETHVGL